LRHDDRELADEIPKDPPKGFASLPSSILHLLSSTAGSPWRFTWTLAYLSASAIVPPPCFHRLKLLLLLVIVLVLEGSELPRLAMDMLVMGVETSLINRLLAHFSQFVKNFVRHSVASTLATKSLTSSVESQPSVLLEAGSLFLARKGLCYLGFLSSLKKSEVDLVKHSLESRSSNVTSATSPGLAQRPHCLAWSICEPDRKKPSGLTPNADSLLDVFGLRVFTDSPLEEVQHVVNELIAQFLLEPSPCSLAASDLRQLLMYAASVDVQLSSDAEALITGYYLASRKRRSNAMRSFPSSAVATLSSLAVAHAKLRISTVASGGDALAAIMLFEENVALHSGYSPFDVLPTPHLVAPEDDIDLSFDADLWLGTGNEKAMAHLYDKLSVAIQGCGLAETLPEY